MGKGTKIALIMAIISLVIAMVVVFIVAKNFFFGLFPEQSTIIGGSEVKGKPVNEAMQVMNSSEGLHMEITKDGVMYPIDVAPFVNRYFSEQQVEDAKDDISFMSYLLHTKVSMPLKPQSAEVDRKKLKKSIENMLPDPKYHTSDAYFDSDWNLIGEVQGDDIDYNALMDQVVSDVENGEELVYQAEAFYYHPKVKADDKNMKKTQKKVKKYKSMSITIKFGSKKKEVITSEKICSNLVLKKGKLKLKTDWADDYVSRLAKEYDTLGTTRIIESTEDGDRNVTGGTLGWKMNTSETTTKLLKALKKLKSSTMEPSYTSRGADFGKKNDFGTSYVEVSITRQHMWVYKKGKMVLDSDVVTGVPNKERMTHPGCYYVYAKQKDRYLGTMAVQGYHTHVDFFMPFHGGEGLHDAPWRHGNFGGTIYQSSGSHGCVNLPPDVAAKLYDIVYLRMPVIVYY